jgi:hypothetical protein
MGFMKHQQVKLAVRLLVWQYERRSIPRPDPEALHRHARQIVDDAHRIARQRGGNVLAILKSMVTDAGRDGGQ